MQQNKKTYASFVQSSEARSVLSPIRLHKFKIMIFLATLLVAFLSTSVYPFPLHASCVIDWKFNANCADVKSKIVDQIKTWNGEDGCKNGGEKCLYKLKSDTTAQVLATHETPKKHYVDDLTFNFNQVSQSVCQVHGHSTSETWYALLDFGTNYCNLENLITGSGLDKTTGYEEATSNSVCTQFSSANCTVY